MFCLGPILSSPLAFLLGFRSFDGALRWDGGRPTLILLVPRDGSGSTRIVETDAFFQFHFANGYEADGAIVVDLVRYPDYLTVGEAVRSYLAIGMAGARHGDPHAPHRRSGGWQGRPAGPATPAAPTSSRSSTRPRSAGAIATSTCLSSPADRPRGLQQQLSKVDVETGTVTRHDFAPDGYPGEPCFVAAPQGAEDDGVVVTLVFDATRRCTDVVGLDARDLAAKPLFVARLKHHVPFMLHGTFIPRA